MPVFIPLPVKNIEVTSGSKLSASKGSLFFKDGFEDTLRWTGGAKDNTAAKVFDGTYSLKLTTNAGSPFTTTSKIMLYPTPELTSSKIAFEFFVQLDKVLVAEVADFSLYINYYAPGTTPASAAHKNFGIKWVSQAATDYGKLQYWNSAGAFADVTDGQMVLPGATSGINVWHRIKLTMDLANNKYVKLEFDNKVFDLSTLSVAIGTATSPYMLVQLAVVGVDATTRDFWFDNFSITYNEP